MPGTTDLQRLIVSMEARYTSLERQLAKASGVANKRARQIETRFQRMNTSLGASFGRLGGLLAGVVSVRAAQQLIDASTRITNSLKVAGLEGEQLTRVYEALFASAQRNAAPIEALAELYGRAALVQKELGISTEELLRFTDRVAVALRVSGKSAQESSGALLQLSQALGSGIVRAEEFNSILEGALPIAQAAAAGLKEAGGSVAALRKLVVDGKVSSEAFFRAFEAGAGILDEKVAGAELTVSQGFIRLQNVLTDAAGKFNKATGASRGLGGALEDVSEVIEDFGDSLANSPIIKFLSDVAAVLDAIQQKAKEVREAIGIEDFFEGTSLLEGRVGFQSDQDAAKLGATLRDIRETFKLIDRSPEPQNLASALAAKVQERNPVKPVSLADYAAPSGDDDKAAEKAADKIKKVTEALAFESEQLKRTARDQEIYNQLQAAGVTINSDAGKAIAAAAGALYDQEFALETSIDRIDDVRDAASDMTSAFVDGIREGKSAVESLGDVLDKLADKLLDSGLDLLISSLLGTSGTPAGGLLSGLFGGGRATGGPINPGKIYKVHKDELIVPRVPGTVIPASQVGRGGGGGSMAISVDVRGARGNAEIMEMVSAGVSQGLAQYDRTLPGKVHRIGQEPRRR